MKKIVMVSLLLFSLNTFGAKYTDGSGVLNCRMNESSQRQHVSYKSYIIQGVISDYVDVSFVDVDDSGIATGQITRSNFSQVHYDGSREIVAITLSGVSAELVDCR